MAPSDINRPSLKVEELLDIVLVEDVHSWDGSPIFLRSLRCYVAPDLGNQPLVLISEALHLGLQVLIGPLGEGIGVGVVVGHLQLARQLDDLVLVVGDLAFELLDFIVVPLMLDFKISLEIFDIDFQVRYLCNQLLSPPSCLCFLCNLRDSLGPEFFVKLLNPIYLFVLGLIGISL